MSAHADLIAQLADVGRTAVAQGLVLASGGNLSARLPGSDEFVVTGTGTYLDRLDASAFSVVRLDGQVRGGNPKPSSEWRLHQRTYLVRPDVNAVIHLHPQYAVLLDALGHQVRLISLDQAYYVRKVSRVPYFPSGSDELADAAAEAARHCNAIILGFHGCSCLADTIAMGFRRAQNLEQAAMTTFRCIQLGNTDLTFPPEWFDRLTTV
ncbi:MAG: class II aldolase/adducin family protein [Candidatus Limnocylindrales bacterium]